MGVDTASLEKALSHIEKAYGKGVVRKGSGHADLVRVPTGIVQLDAIIGGGLPLGRWVHGYGGYGSAKTLTFWHMVREAQKMGLTVAYYDIENQYDEKWVRSIGVNVDDLLVVDGSVIEEVGEILENLLPSVNIHILDSLGLGVSTDELAAGVSEWRPGIGARAWGKVIRRANKYFDKEKNMVVMINQTREVFGRGGGEEPTGGRAIGYISSLNLHFKKSSWLFKDKNGNLSTEGEKTNSITGDIEPSGIEFQVRVAKARVNAKKFGTARMRLELGSGGEFDRMWALVRAAIFFQLVQRKGSWYQLPDGTSVQGETKLREYIEQNDEFANQIMEMIFKDEN